MIDQTAIRRLAYDFYVTAFESDDIGLRGVLWAVNELDELSRATVFATIDGMGVRALRRLAEEWDMSPTEALDRLTDRR
jgi:hypothetical protein